MLPLLIFLAWFACVLVRDLGMAHLPFLVIVGSELQTQTSFLAFLDHAVVDLNRLFSSKLRVAPSVDTKLDRIC